MQKEIALSICKAEYIRLSQCAQALIPLHCIIDNLSSKFKDPCLGSDGLPTSTFLTPLDTSIIREDNAACVILANDGDKYRPRTRHLSIKWHHFRDQVKAKKLAVTKIDTKKNWSDILLNQFRIHNFLLSEMK